MNEDQYSLKDFSGTARLFPLPNLVLFPHVMQPLHIFEQRYRQMTHDALASDRLLALALLQPGWEANYQNAPPIYSVVCLGKIVADHELDDGRYNLLVRGVSRAAIVDEVDNSRLYREADVQLLEDAVMEDGMLEFDLRKQIAELIPSWFTGSEPVNTQLEKLLSSDMTIGAVCDILSFALPLPVLFKQQLLEELSVQRRCESLLDHMKRKKGKPFPPEFSDN